jgi:hypothetical protein
MIRYNDDELTEMQFKVLSDCKPYYGNLVIIELLNRIIDKIEEKK